MAEPVSHTAEVARVFHRLGWTSFGGPSAHFAYFRHEFVLRRRWLDEQAYAEWLAFVQLLPGPSSSQLAVILGIGRAGLPGGLLAWLGFTLPSALIMLGFALVVEQWGGHFHEGWLHGLKVVVLGVVAQATLSMFRRLCPDWPRRVLALVALTVALALAGSPGQLSAIALGGLVGWLRLGHRVGVEAQAPTRMPVRRRTGVVCLALFFGLLLLLPAMRTLDPSGVLALLDGFYRAGALVFGGGHVILPLLQAEVVRPGFVGQELFLAGYGVAQALPGPIFTFATYLGALAAVPLPALLTAALCLLVLFLPSVLLLLGVLPFWTTLRALPGMGGALAGVGAAVVGLLGAVLIDPIWPTAIQTPLDLLLAGAVFAVLLWGRMPPWLVVVAGAAIGAMLPA